MLQILPVPAFNIINGGSHAGNALAMQVSLLLDINRLKRHKQQTFCSFVEFVGSVWTVQETLGQINPDTSVSKQDVIFVQLTVPAQAACISTRQRGL